MSRRLRYALIVLAAAATGTIVFAIFRPRPTRLAVTARAGDDTVVINQSRATRLNAALLDQYGRRMPVDTVVQYRWIGGDTMRVTPGGAIRCSDRRDAVVRATFAHLSREFMLRCRPVVSIEAPTWLDLVVGDSTREIAFVARGPDGRPVTELRGTLLIADPSVVALQGTTLRPARAGATSAVVEAGDAAAHIPIVVYRDVRSFVDGGGRRGDAMAMHIRLNRGDTIVVPVPKAAFWVTYFSKDHDAAPPTIELQGDGSCTTGDGIRIRRMERDKYGKYCLAGNGVRMMIAHGAGGAETVEGTVAVRIQW